MTGTTTKYVIKYRHILANDVYAFTRRFGRISPNAGDVKVGQFYFTPYDAKYRLQPLLSALAEVDAVLADCEVTTESK